MLARDLRKGTFIHKKIIIKTASEMVNAQIQNKNKIIWIKNWNYPDGDEFEFDLKLIKKYTAKINHKISNKVNNEKVLEYYEFSKKENIIWKPIINQLVLEMEQNQRFSIYQYQLTNLIRIMAKNQPDYDERELINYAINTGQWRIQNYMIIFNELEYKHQQHIMQQTENNNVNTDNIMHDANTNNNLNI